MATDFRAYAFDAVRLRRTARYVGNNSYRMLYESENIIRVVVNSVLLVQIGPDWWGQAVDQRIREQADRFRQRYMSRPWHTPQGDHGIYYVFLADLAEILRANSGLFLAFVPDIDQWIAKIESINLPRNVVGHMNFLTPNDRTRIALFQDDVAHLPGLLQTAAVPVVVP